MPETPVGKELFAYFINPGTLGGSLELNVHFLDESLLPGTLGALIDQAWIICTSVGEEAVVTENLIRDIVPEEAGKVCWEDET